MLVEIFKDIEKCGGIYGPPVGCGLLSGGWWLLCWYLV